MASGKNRRDRDGDELMSYYAKKLSAERLRMCYQLAPPRARRYLAAELAYVLDEIGPDDSVLELGCGYGRVLREIAARAKATVGIDTSTESLDLARKELSDLPSCKLLSMDAAALDFPDASFDLVVCIQNGISAFRVDLAKLVGEALRVTRPNGTVLFSTYAPGFWEERLTWFRRQAEHGLIGEIDEARTGDGVIVCKDGFQVGTITPERFLAVLPQLEDQLTIEEVDGSSLFFKLKPG